MADNSNFRIAVVCCIASAKFSEHESDSSVSYSKSLSKCKIIKNCYYGYKLLILDESHLLHHV